MIDCSHYITCNQIRNMEHMLVHETMPLKDEKQFIHQIKQFKQTRERIYSSMSKQDEVLQGLDQKDQIEERVKVVISVYSSYTCLYVFPFPILFNDYRFP